MRIHVVTLALLLGVASPAFAQPVAVAPQYDTVHVYVAPQDVDRFVASFVATFGGKTSKKIVATVTPTPSRTISQLVITPVGMLSVFGFTTPIPAPFGAERTGYLVTDMDAAIRAARAAGADVLVAPFADPIGRDAIVQWPGGATMQLYAHYVPPSLPPLATIPENRFYVSREKADEFVDGFLRFSKGAIVSDDRTASGVEIGRPGDIFRRVRIASDFGKLTVLVTDGHLPFPFGRETCGYEVSDLAATLAKARAAGATILVEPFKSEGREAAMVQFPGGYIAEVHTVSPP